MTTPDESDETTPLPGLSDHDRIKRIEAMTRRFKRYLWAAVLSAGASIGGAGTLLLQRAEARGATEQWKKDTDDKLKEIKDDIREIRALCHRVSGQDVQPEVQHLAPPDRVSSGVDPGILHGRLGASRLARPEVAEAAGLDQAAALDVAAADPAARAARLKNRLTGLRWSRRAGGDDPDQEQVAHAPTLPHYPPQCAAEGL